MSQYSASVEWTRSGAVFTDHRYSRAHRWSFDGGAVVAASSSPQVVRLPFSDPAGVDPEEAFVVSLASCHMLWFLDLAARRGFTVERYVDDAEGHMERNAAGKEWIARVVLRPSVEFSGPTVPDDAAVDALHHAAHAECFIANSVRTEVLTHGTWRHAA